MAMESFDFMFVLCSNCSITSGDFVKTTYICESICQVDTYEQRFNALDWQTLPHENFCCINKVSHPLITTQWNKCATSKIIFKCWDISLNGIKSPWHGHCRVCQRQWGRFRLFGRRQSSKLKRVANVSEICIEITMKKIHVSHRRILGWICFDEGNFSFSLRIKWDFFSLSAASFFHHLCCSLLLSTHSSFTKSDVVTKDSRRSLNPEAVTLWKLEVIQVKKLW